MQAASRESLAAARERLDAITSSADEAAPRALSDELFAVLGVLARERVLRRHLTDPAAPEQARRRLASGLFAGKVSDVTLDCVLGLVASRWSVSTDLVDALEMLAQQASLTLAERDGSIEDVEDELFRFGRILDVEPRLRVLLADETVAADRRVALLDQLIEGKVRPVTQQLLEQVIRVPLGRSLELAVGKLAELAAARRDRAVAHVTAATALTEAQESRLAQALSNIFGRAVSVQVDLDPGLLGGLVIRVGDEVIDGSVAARLARARQQLPS